MIIDRKTTLMPAPSVPAPNRPISNLRSDLGLLATWKVNSIERRAKAAAVGELAQIAVAAALDIEKAQIEAHTTTIKTALMARAVPIMGALMEEVTVRGGQVRLGFQTAEKQGLKYQIEFRHQAQAEMAELHARGCLSDDELEEVQQYLAKMTAAGVARQSHDMERIHEALGHHMDRVVDHVKNPEKKGS